MLAELSVLGQRLVARHQRISLPRDCSADVRHARLRHALCHAATVRSSYLMLDETTQLALQELRARRRGIDPA